MNFHVGQKVVCVDNSPHSGRRYDELYRLQRGQIYTIRSFDTEDASQMAGIRLEEIILTIPHGWTTEDSWFPTRFRPLVTRKTCIKIFKKLLIPTPQKVSA